VAAEIAKEYGFTGIDGKTPVPSHPPMSDKVAAFEKVKKIGFSLPDVEATTKYDGSPVLKLGGCFMAGLATHRSAEPDTLVVRCGCEDRERLLEDSAETYYVTDYYRRYPLVLVRLSCVNRDALHDLLSVSWRMTASKTRKRPPTPKSRDYIGRR
jgi:hypothetical protein